MSKTEVRSAQIRDGSGVDLTVDVYGTLPIINGGTGISSPGPSGNVLVSNGNVWVSSSSVPSASFASSFKFGID